MTKHLFSGQQMKNLSGEIQEKICTEVITSSGLNTTEKVM